MIMQNLGIFKNSWNILVEYCRTFSTTHTSHSYIYVTFQTRKRLQRVEDVFNALKIRGFSPTRWSRFKNVSNALETSSTRCNPRSFENQFFQRVEALSMILSVGLITLRTSSTRCKGFNAFCTFFNQRKQLSPASSPSCQVFGNAVSFYFRERRTMLGLVLLSILGRGL